MASTVQSPRSSHFRRADGRVEAAAARREERLAGVREAWACLASARVRGLR